MTAFVMECRSCGASYELDRRAIVRGVWKLCPTCRASGDGGQAPMETRCRECGRPLYAGGRTLCLSCMGAPL